MRYNYETDNVEIYIDGEWVKWQKASMKICNIYTDGIQNIPLTTSYSSTWNDVQANVRFKETYIELESYQSSSSRFGTDTPIDLTYYEKMCVEYTTASNSTKQIITGNISELTGERYIFVRLTDYNGKNLGIGTNVEKAEANLLVELNTNAVTRIHRIWLE